MGGFTLLELLVVLVIIGWLAAMSIPKFLDAMLKAKQKRTVHEMRDTGTAMMNWLTDHTSAAAAGSTNTLVSMSDFTAIDTDALSVLLQATYTYGVPRIDGWRNPYDYYLDTTGSYGLKVMAIRSPGQLGQFDSDVYTAGPFDSSDYEQDIVWTDGYFVRWPE